MSSKSDRDNRSNQLNPNNAAYESSRSGVQRDDSDDYAVSSERAYRRYRPSSWVRDERDFALGFVGQHGQVRLFKLRLNVPHLEGGCFPRTEHRYDDFLEHICTHVRRMLTVRWRVGIALQMAFDEKGEVIKWMTSRHLQGDRLERCDKADPACPAGNLVQPGDMVGAGELLARAARPPLENWGSFDLPTTRLSALSFDFEERCQRAVKGQVA